MFLVYGEFLQLLFHFFLFCEFMVAFLFILLCSTGACYFLCFVYIREFRQRLDHFKIQGYSFVRLHCCYIYALFHNPDRYCVFVRFESWMTQLKQQQARHQQSHSGSLHSSPHGQGSAPVSQGASEPSSSTGFQKVFIFTQMKYVRLALMVTLLRF